MKYRVGDKVKVKEGLIGGIVYGKHAFVDSMKIYRGEIFEVNEVMRDGYHLEGANIFCFTDEMLEPVEVHKEGDGIIVPDPEHDNIFYLQFHDGLRIRFEDGKYAGYYNCNPEVEEAKPKEKYYNGKVVCVGKTFESASYTVGKIYEFVDGKVKCNNGNAVPSTDSLLIKTLEEWNYAPWALAKFIEIKE